MAPWHQGANLSFLFLFLLSFSFTSAVGLDNTDIPLLRTEVIETNISVDTADKWDTNLGNMTSANATQFDNNGGTFSIDTSWISSLGSNLWCTLTGCTMSGNIDLDGYNLTNVGNIEGTSPLHVGDGLIVDGNTSTEEYLIANNQHDNKVRIGSLPGFPQFPAIFFGSDIPSATNYAFLYSVTETILNHVSQFTISVSNNPQLQVTDGLVKVVHDLNVSETVETENIIVRSNLTDPTGNMGICFNGTSGITLSANLTDAYAEGYCS